MTKKKKKGGGFGTGGSIGDKNVMIGIAWTDKKKKKKK